MIPLVLPQDILSMDQVFVSQPVYLRPVITSIGGKVSPLIFLVSVLQDPTNLLFSFILNIDIYRVRLTVSTCMVWPKSECMKHWIYFVIPGHKSQFINNLPICLLMQNGPTNHCKNSWLFITFKCFVESKN